MHSFCPQFKTKELRKSWKKCLYIYVDDKVGGLKSIKSNKEKAKLTQWLAFLCSSSTDNRDPPLFSMVEWAIWNRRNNLRLGKPAAPLNELLSQSQDRLREFKLYNSLSIIPVGRPPTSWQAPNSDTYKVNFDGALFAAENSAGLGVVIRNAEGQVMVSLSEKTTLPFTAIEVEAMAVRRALTLALETGFQQIILLADTHLSTRKQHSLSVKFWPHNERHSVFCLLFFKNTLLLRAHAL
ncbi:hypothetical protein SO802_023105 [Lithocarpus litseifolius]|uniref:RNase H type-1 domain-containing protein n=1 Tax=Lithocarpus litseifolius TaxID=425828 RepID=A0AAW2C5P3_9ROSI